MYRKPGKPQSELPQPHMNRAVVAVKHHEAHDRSGTNSTRTKIPSYFTSSQASSTYTRVDIYLPKQTKQQQQKPNPSFSSISCCYEATDSLPFFIQVQQGFFNNGLCKIHFSLLHWASKVKAFLWTVFLRRELIPYCWQFTLLATAHFMMHKRTTPVGTSGICRKQKYKC